MQKVLIVEKMTSLVNVQISNKKKEKKLPLLAEIDHIRSSFKEFRLPPAKITTSLIFFCFLA